MTRRLFTQEELARFRSLVERIKSESYQLPQEGQLIEPSGRERHSKRFGEREDK